jgi:hypothetical protein
VYAGQERKMYAGYLVLQNNNLIIDDVMIFLKFFSPSLSNSIVLIVIYRDQP